ncbi:MAG: hypothetical protein ACTSYE_11795 [Alphaproteobacteria bacterium]
MRIIKLLAGRPTTLLVASLALICASVVIATTARAQSTNQTLGGAVVDVAGNGGDIDAGGAVVTIRGPANAIRVGGASVDVRAQTTDDVWAFGAQLSIDGEIGRDLKAGGGLVRVDGVIDGDAKIGGVVVDINARIGGDLRAVGASLTIGRNTTVGGDFTGGGATVRMAGDVVGDVRLGGAVVDFAGIAGGDVTLTGEDISIGGLAVIGGDLTVYARNAPVVSPGASIGGQVQHFRPDEQWFDIPDWMLSLGFAAFLAAGTIVAGFVLLLFGGRLLPSAANAVRRGPVSSLLLGIVTLIVIPLISVILLATGIGVTAAVAVLLTMPFLVVFGHATAATGIAGGLLVGRRTSIGPIRAFIFLLIGSIVIGLASLIPWVGTWLVAVLIVTGVGGFARTVARRLRRREPEMEAAPDLSPEDSALPDQAGYVEDDAHSGVESAPAETAVEPRRD